MAWLLGLSARFTVGNPIFAQEFTQMLFEMGGDAFRPGTEKIPSIDFHAVRKKLAFNVDNEVDFIQSGMDNLPFLDFLKVKSRQVVSNVLKIVNFFLAKKSARTIFKLFPRLVTVARVITA